MLFLFAETLHRDQLQNVTIVECNTVTAAMVWVHAEAYVCLSTTTETAGGKSSTSVISPKHV